MEILLFVGPYVIVLMLIDVYQRLGYAIYCSWSNNHCIAINCRFLVFRVEGTMDDLSLEKSLNDLLIELRQTQTPLEFESDTSDNPMSRPDPQALQERVLTTTRNSPTLYLD